MSTKKAAHRGGRSELYKCGNWNGKKRGAEFRRKKKKSNERNNTENLSQKGNKALYTA